MKKQTKIILLTIGIVFTLFIVYILTFGLIRPFDNTITQNKPIMKFLCEMQVECNSNIGNYRCSFEGRLRESSVDKLNSWNGYKGCNESTSGYFSDGKYGKIRVESCSCGGLM